MWHSCFQRIDSNTLSELDWNWLQLRTVPPASLGQGCRLLGISHCSPSLLRQYNSREVEDY